MKKLFTRHRRWLGAALVMAGAGMTLVHYIDYGLTAHWVFPDHGLFGLLLVIAGVFLGIGKAGEKQK